MRQWLLAPTCGLCDKPATEVVNPFLFLVSDKGTALVHVDCVVSQEGFVQETAGELEKALKMLIGDENLTSVEITR